MIITEVRATVTSKGRVTIPAAVRRRLGLAKGDRVLFVIEADGSVSIRTLRYPTVASLAGAAGTLPRAMTWQEMCEVASEDRLARKPGIAGA